MKTIFTKIWLVGFGLYVLAAIGCIIHTMYGFIASGIEFSIMNYTIYSAQTYLASLALPMILGGVFFIVTMHFVLND